MRTYTTTSLIAVSVMLSLLQVESFSTTTSSPVRQSATTGGISKSSPLFQPEARLQNRNDVSLHPATTTTALSATPAVGAIAGALTGGVLGGALHAIAGE
jgi:uncharacterized membrane protein YoaK (UPF0700 family)